MMEHYLYSSRLAILLLNIASQGGDIRGQGKLGGS